MPLIRQFVVRTITAVACLTSTACLSTTSPGGTITGTGVLFIGNSLTYTNDLPGMVAAVSRAGGRPVSVASLALPNRALVDFVLDGSAQRAIQGGTWTHVVMQQGPTTVPICRDTLVLAVKQLDQWGKLAGATSVVMMSWPTTARPQDFPRALESAHIAAKESGAKMAPAGEAWRLALSNDPQLPLYGGDGYHPAPLGTLVAAMVLYEQLTGGDARQLPDSALRMGGVSTLTPAVLVRLREAAHTANENARTAVVPAWTPAAPPNPAITC